MSLAEIGILVSIVLGVVGAAGAMYRYFNGKIARVYERFDEYKQNVESKFVYREMCNVLHQNNSANFTKLETRMEDGFKSVYQKLDDLQKIFLKQKGAI